MTPVSIDLHVGEGFAAWLEAAASTVVVTTYQAGKIVLLGHDGARVTVVIRDLVAPMGVAVEGADLAVAQRESVATWRVDGGRYTAGAAIATGDLRAHEIAFGREGLWLVNTRQSSLGIVHADGSFEARWRPQFISGDAAAHHGPPQAGSEDRCHLSGLAMDDGAPAYATAHAATDSPGGWREKKLGGGVVIDVATGAPLAGGFTMPHSPRVAGGALWLLDSGQGVLLRVDRETGARAPIARFPGFARGLCVVGDRALVGLSKIREAHVFGGLPIAARHAELVCGVAVVDVTTGNIEGLVRFRSGCEEIFDVAIIPAKRVRLG